MRRIIKVLTLSSPLLLLISMVLSFVLLFIMQCFYYYIILESGLSYLNWIASIGFAFLVQLIRLSSGLAGAYEISKGKYWQGVIGLLLSFAVTVFETFDVSHIYEFWHSEYGTDKALYHMMQFTVWAGFILEIRFMMTINSIMDVPVNDETEITEDTAKK